MAKKPIPKHKKIVEGKIKRIIKDKSKGFPFRNFLKTTNANFFYLKQENQIRNYFVTVLNKNKNYHAYAEYPRKGSIKIDLSVISKNDLFLAEFKYQFAGDRRVIENAIYDDLICRKINVKNKKKKKRVGIDLLILIIIECYKPPFDKHLKSLDRQHGLEAIMNLKKNTYRYQLDQNNAHTWKHDLENMLNNLPIAWAPVNSIKINTPFQSTYHFYLIKKSQDSPCPSSAQNNSENKTKRNNH